MIKLHRFLVAFAMPTGLALIGLLAPVPLAADPVFRNPVLREYQPVQIALPNFAAGSPAEAELANVIAEIIASDLRGSRVFVPIDAARSAEQKLSVDEVPRFADWRGIRAQELVAGRVTRQADTRLKVEFRLWDVSNGTQLAGQTYVGAPDDSDRIGHLISETIYERVTGEQKTFGSGSTP